MFALWPPGSQGRPMARGGESRETGWARRGFGWQDGGWETQHGSDRNEGGNIERGWKRCRSWSRTDGKQGRGLAALDAGLGCGRPVLHHWGPMARGLPLTGGHQGSALREGPPGAPHPRILPATGAPPAPAGPVATRRRHAWGRWLAALAAAVVWDWWTCLVL